ncbi:MAG: glycerate kinase [Nitrospira sp.]|nr:glycerate kinase [Nitrospira sp.]MDH4304075.1 glycerate kinase [Nitrospira sp.]MDH5194657.1 glycerate kinase [Nitrospira sp.]
MLLRLPSSPARPLLLKLIAAGLEAADPYQALIKAIALDGPSLRVGRRTFDLSHTRRVIAVGAGKASARMAQALEVVLGERLEGGLVIVKTGHSLPTGRTTILEAGHPIPNRAGLVATQRLLRLVQDLTPRDLLIVLLSGGASSLLPAPVSDVMLADKQRTTQLLLRCGATINEINVVRKHLSLIKGGGLATSTGAKIVTLVLSDVIGDDLGSIGSGPTAADPSTFAEAIGVLRRYQIWTAVPPAVRRYLQKGQQGEVPETLKPGSPREGAVHHHIIGSNHIMLDAVAHTARQAGLLTKLVSAPITGEASVAAKQFVELSKAVKTGRGRVQRPYCVVAGGEATVTVTGHGKGGRAQEFAAAAALEISGLPNAWVVALGSDGTDGPTDAAGALVSGETVSQATRLKVNLHTAVNRHNAYPALKKLGCHIHTGPTGTNVNDLYLFLQL